MIKAKCKFIVLFLKTKVEKRFRLIELNFTQKLVYW